jgi:hypothetical protein
MNSAILLALLATPWGQMEDQFHQDFRGAASLNPTLTLFGPDSGKAVQFEPEGLRITMPAGRADKAAVGLAPNLRISGDFEITVGYEILSAERPAEGMGA